MGVNPLGKSVVRGEKNLLGKRLFQLHGTSGKAKMPCVGAKGTARCELVRKTRATTLN